MIICSKINKYRLKTLVCIPYSPSDFKVRQLLIDWVWKIHSYVAPISNCCDVVQCRHLPHKHLLLKYRWYGELWREEGQVLESVGCIGASGFTAHHQERAGEHKTGHSTLSTTTHTHTLTRSGRQIITDDLCLSRLGLLLPVTALAS